MTTALWILLVIVFVGLHLFMHGGHGAHGRPRLSRDGGRKHDAHEGTPSDGPSTETEQHRHGGC